jgi:hypothetical protein
MVRVIGKGTHIGGADVQQVINLARAIGHPRPSWSPLRSIRATRPPDARC